VRSSVESWSAAQDVHPAVAGTAPVDQDGLARAHEGLERFVEAWAYVAPWLVKDHEVNVEEIDMRSQLLRAHEYWR